MGLNIVENTGDNFFYSFISALSPKIQYPLGSETNDDIKIIIMKIR